MANPSGTNPVVSEITVAGCLITSGSGAPTFSASKGSLFVRTDTGASTTATRLYINSTGATAWVAITTAS